MEYLLQQIWICLVLIALIAGFTGWFLRGGSKNKIKVIEEEWNVKLARAQNERDYYAGEVKNLNAVAQEREEVEQNYQSEKQALSVQLDDMRVDAEMTTEAFDDQERLLKQQAIELEESNRALLIKKDKQEQFEQIESQLQRTEEKISDLQTELDSTKIQLLDTTDKLSITESLLVESQRQEAQEGQTILLVKDEIDSPSPSPIQTKEEITQVQARYIPGVGSLLSTPTSSVEIVDAHDKKPIESVKSVEQALDDAFADREQSKVDHSDYKSATLAGAGAAALGMAGKMKDKLNQVKEERLDRTDHADDTNIASDVYVIQDIHTISSEESKSLNQMNIMSTEDIIVKCATKAGVELVAKNMGKESWVVRSWASMADLMRVQGVDAVNAELLELSGVSSVQVLASAKINKLTESIKVIHKHVGKTNHVPDSDEIGAWIESAEGLPERLDNNLDKL